MASGYSVPSSTVAQATSSSRLLSSTAVSREASAVGSGPRPSSRRWPWRAYSPIAPSRKPAISPSRNTPRRGSVANACTEVITPERTRNSPSSDSMKAPMASTAVQCGSARRPSRTASVCASAASTSQGMNEAFSTGSQNHQPPQPSS